MIDGAGMSKIFFASVFELYLQYESNVSRAFGFEVVSYPNSVMRK